MHKIFTRIFISAFFISCIFLFQSHTAYGQCNAVADSLDATGNCVPKTVSFTGVNSTGAISSYFWNWGDGGIDTTAIPQNHTYNSSGVFNAMLVITCGAVRDTDFFTVTVLPPPAGSFTLSDDSICTNLDTLFITNTSTFNGSYTYQWETQPDGVFIGTGLSTFTGFNPPGIKYFSSGNKTITLTITDNSNLGCVNTISASLLVGTTPSPAFSLDKDSACIPATVRALNNTSNPAQIETWVWDFTDPPVYTTSVKDSPSHTYNNAGTYVVKLTTTTFFGCSNFSTKPFVAKNSPTATFTISPSPVCAFDTVTITYTGTGSGSATYAWNFAGGTVIAGSGQGPYQVKWTNGNPTIKNLSLIVTELGCSGNYSDSVQVIQVDTLSLSVTDDSICAGDNVTFTALPTGMSQYRFFVNGALVKSSPSNKYSSSALNDNDVISVTGIEASGCSTFPGNTITMQVNPKPVVSLTDNVANDSICAGSSVTFTANPAGYDQYDFYVGFQLVKSGAGRTYSTDSLQDGDVITVYATDLGCISAVSNAISITIIDPLDVPVPNCGATTDTTVEFCWDPVAGATGYTYRFRINGGGFTAQSTAGTCITITGLSASDQVDLQVRANGNAPCGNTVFSSLVTCFAIPCSGMDFDKDPAPSVCLGDSVTLSISNLTSPSAQRCIQWDGGSCTQNTSYTYLPSSVGIDTVSVSLYDSSQSSCPAIVKYFFVTVNPIPVPTVSDNDANDTICFGESITFTASPASYDNYKFFRGVTVYQNSANPSVAISTLPVGLDTVWVEATDNGCSDTIFSAAIRVLSLPNVTLTHDAVNDSICENDSITVTASGTLANYEFFVNGFSRQDGSSKTFKWKMTTGDSIISVVGTNSNSCSSTNNNADTIKVVALPTVNISLPTKDTTINNCDSILFRAINAGTGMTYKFYVDGIEVQDSSIRTWKDILTGGTHTVKVAAINKFGCMSNFTDSVIVTVSPKPVTLTSDKSVICAGDSITFTSSLINKTEFYSFFNGSTPVQSTGSNIHGTRLLNDGDVFRAVAIDSNGCASDTSNSIIITVIPIPVAGIINVSGTDTVCEGATVTLAVDTVISGDTYSWTGGLTDDTVTVTPSVPSSTYTLTLTRNGCTSSPASRTILAFAIPAADAGSDVTICRGNDTLLNATGGTNYLWAPVDSLASLLEAIKQSPATKKLYDTTKFYVVVSNWNCIDIDSVTIFIDKCLDELAGDIPEIITPNGDGKNDFWAIPDIDYFPNNNVLIFNRWGQIVYTKDKYQNDWDGKNESGVELPTGTYYYVLDLGNGRDAYKGFIMIQR